MARWALQPTCSARPPLLVCFRTYETSLLVEEAISEELPYSGKDHPMMPPEQEGHFHKTPKWPGLKAGGKFDFLRALQTKPLNPGQGKGWAAIT